MQKTFTRLNHTILLFCWYSILLTFVSSTATETLAQTNPKIAITNGLVPSCVTEEQALNLTINGSNFATQANQQVKVRIKGSAFQEQFVLAPQLPNSATQIRIQIPANSVILSNPGILTIDIQQADTAGKNVFSNAVQLPVYPKTGAISGLSTVCGNTQNTYTLPVLAGASSYEWSIESGNAAIISSSITNTVRIDFTNTSGTVRISAKTIHSCGTTGSTSTLAINVSETPPVSLPAFNVICVNALAFSLNSGSPAGGTYTVDGVVANSFDPAAAGLGDHVIAYYSTQNGCSASATQTIQVKPSPAVSFPVALPPVCVNAAPVALSGGVPAGGTFSGPGVTSTTFDPAVAGVGEHAITYSFSQNGCNSTAVQIIIVLPAPAIELPAFNATCVDAPAFSLNNGSPAGGTYTVDGVVANSFDPAAAGLGDHVIAYYSTQNGCSASATQTIQVKPSPAVSFPVALPPVCVNVAPLPLSGGLAAKGTFSGPGVVMDDEIYKTVRWGNPNTNFSYNIPVSNRQYTVILHFADNNWKESGQRSFDVTIEDTKVLDNYDIVDKAGPNTATTETFRVTIADGTLNINFIGLTSEGGKSDPTVCAIEVISTTPPSETYRINAGGSQLTNAIGEFAADNYFSEGFPFTFNNPIGGTITNFNPALAGVGEHTITYSFSQNGCQNTAAQNITVLNQPVAAISAPAEGTQVCQGAFVTLTATPLTGATYQWFMDGNSLPNAINNSYNAGVSGNYTVQITDDNCSTISDSIVVTVLAPSNLLIEKSPVSFCAGSETTLHALPGNGYQYQWYKDNLLLDNETQESLIINQGGKYRVILTPSGCEPITSDEIVITQIPEIKANTIATTANQAICSGSTIQITGPKPGGGTGEYSYQWQGSTDNSIFYDIPGETNQNYTYFSDTNLGTISFRRIVTSGPCSNISNQVAVTVHQVITNNTIATPGTDTICAEGIAGTITGSLPAGNANFTYTWESSLDGATFTTIPNTNRKDYTPGPLSQSTLFRRVVTSGQCTSISNDVRITVNERISGNTIAVPTIAFCNQANPGTISSEPVAGGEGTYQYVWQTSLDGTSFETVPNVNTAEYTPGILTRTTAFRRVITSGPCTDTSNVLTITINAAISGNDIGVPNDTICINSDPGTINSDPVIGGERTYEYVWEKSLDGKIFETIQEINTAEYTPGFLTQTTAFRRVVTSGVCADTSNVLTITVEPIATYTIFLTVASSFPVCGQASYTATVIKNVKVVNYPTDPRYQQVSWDGGDDVTQQFIFDWWKNDKQSIITGNPSRTKTLEELQPGEYYTVRARPVASGLSCKEYNNRPDLIATGSNLDFLFSNRIYMAKPDAYAVSITSDLLSSVCPGTPVTFTAIANNSNYVNQSYQWIVNGKDIPGANQATFSSSQLKDGDEVSVRFDSDENTCTPITADNPITIQVRDQIKNKVERIDGPGKPEVGKPAAYLAIPNDNTVDWLYQWTIFYTDGQEETPSESSATLDITSVRTYISAIQVKQIAPEVYCLDQDTATASLLLEPIAKLAYQSTCDSDTIRFENQSTTGLGIEYLWDFNYQGKTSQAINPVFAYPRTNIIQTFNVKLTVTNTRNSKSAFITVPIKVYPKLEVKAGNDQILCVAAAAVTLTDYAPTGGSWTGKGVSTDGIFNPARAGIGTHTITYTVTQNGCTAKATQTITVTPALPVKAGANQAVCIGVAAFLLTDFSPSGGSWSGKGVTTNGTFNPSAAGTGVHILTYTVSQNGCSSSSTREITVKPLPVVRAGQDQKICVNAGAFTITGQNPSGGSWSGPGVLPDGKFDPQKAGTGIHELIYTITQDGCSSQATKKISVTSLSDIPVIIASGSVTFCAGSSVELSIASQANTFYKWQLNGSPVGQDNASLVVKTSGNYTVKVYNDCGEVASKGMNITVVPIPAAPQATNVRRCGTGKLTLSATGSSNGNFRWFISASGGTPMHGEQNNTFTTPAISETTTYYVSVVSGSCESERVPVQAIILPSPVADAGEDQVIRIGDQAALAGNGGVSYSWSPATALSDPTIANPVAKPAVTTTYILTVTSPTGCTSTDEVTIEVLQDVIIPNAFTPNNDGTNDLWNIQHIESYPNCTIKIYNRWGSIVYESVGYQQSWNGTLDGQELPVTTYFYTIDLKDGRKPLVGHVSIIR